MLAVMFAFESAPLASPIVQVPPLGIVFTVSVMFCERGSSRFATVTIVQVSFPSTV